MKNIVVQIARKFEDVEFDANRIEKLVKAVCNRFKLNNATVSIAIVDRNEMLRINKEFLNCTSDTDVISFDLSDNKDAKLFELVINAQKALSEAKLRGHSTLSELALYIVHGLLHNLGYNDADEEQAKKMHQIEDEILKDEGFGLVFRH